ncbi:crotonobetainyl-CoA:carnitine CoA-transferase CaiB-like acyl-CoA transferase [Murinocardiopsis flavida]|uniref:Crotonobetainyl-CoA:carnitine CoA-transferase CaiB-like acyl-CoA transferase n=1 Tax=Murinocardiopsis flavida TaxID=645275 RepID=A0A2P8DKG3_9ACTN|nr:CoA transferase [Murinocardiopsis flavida]PSK97704.1 crotonobetainyl-CoA:carnitine CoA-transferase CaiB-like acyl-CoA transferase [Murinocardiopsis flavida]
MSGGPLEGILVADFSRVLAGPLASSTLADFGATVVKVERPGGGDDTRAWGPPWTGESSAYFECANRSKRSAALDLAEPEGAAAARALARRADVVVENFRPGGLARYGLGYDQVRAANPGVVYCSISGFGSAGGASLSGYDFIVQAVGGLMSITGAPDAAPTKAGVALVDVLTGKDAVTGILAALRHRDSTGAGQHVEVNLLASLLASLANQSAGYLATGDSPRRMGNRHPSIAPYETLACADGLLAVAAGNDRQFGALGRAVGRPELADDPRFRGNADRVRNRDALVAELEGALAHRTTAAWEERLRAAGVPCGPVNDIGTAFAFAADLGLDPLHDMGEGRIAQPRNPIGLSGSPPTAPTPPPRLGEHTDEVLAWLTSEAPAPLSPLPGPGSGPPAP